MTHEITKNIFFFFFSYSSSLFIKDDFSLCKEYILIYIPIVGV